MTMKYRTEQKCPAQTISSGFFPFAETGAGVESLSLLALGEQQHPVYPPNADNTGK